MKTLSRGSALGFALGLSALALGACTDSSPSGDPGTEVEESDVYRLRTEFLGERQALAARAVGGEIELAFETGEGEDGHLAWRFVDGEDGFFRVTNRAFGEGLSLDVIDDGVFDRPALVPSSDASGQRWRVTRLDNGFCRLTTDFLGPDLALDVTSEIETRDLAIRTVGNFSGQHWAFERVGREGSLQDACPGRSAGVLQRFAR